MSNPAITALITICETYEDYPFNRDFRLLGGKPMYRIMIDKLLSVKQVGSIVILSDSNEVKSAFSGNGKVRVISYPGGFSEDNNERMVQQFPTSDHMVAHALKQVDGEHFMQVQCVNPFLTVATLDEAINRYYQYVLKEEAYPFDSVMSLSRLEKRLYNTNNYPVIELRSDPWHIVYEDSIIQVFNRAAFRKNGSRKFGKNPMFLETREIENLAVETDESYELAKLIHENRSRFPYIFQG